MPKADLVIRGGRLVLADALVPGSLVVRDGRIAALVDPGYEPPAESELDAAGLVVMPGAIDTHVHLRDPGTPEREDFTTGTAAAAAGGITTILEMPISVPPVSSVATLRGRMAAARGRAHVDYAFYAGAGGDNVAEIPDLARAGAVAFKTFMHEPVPGREQEFAGLCAPEDGALYEVFRAVAATGRKAAVHAESNSLVKAVTGALRRRGRRDPLAHAEGRPELAEALAVARILTLAEATGVRLQVVHMSTAWAGQLVQAARARGVDVTVETCPHYLFLSQADLERHGPFAKCNPPLRSPATVAALWQQVQDGTVDMVGSDHAPYLYEEKAAGAADIWVAPAGFPGLELLVPLLLTAVTRDKLTLPQVSRLVSGNAAREFGLAPRKGALVPGADADLMLVDPEKTWQAHHDRWLTRARGVALVYDGLELTGSVEATLVRGTVVFRHGEVVGHAGHGMLVVPPDCSA